MRLSVLAAAACAACAGASAAVSQYNLPELLALNPFTATLTSAVEAAGLAGALSSKGPFTVFAPDDVAFDRLPPGVLPGLLKNKTLLSEVLLYHVAAGNVSSFQLTDGEQVPTLDGGAKVLVNIFKDPRDPNITAVQLDRTAFVTYANNYASNGVYHVIDRVLIPRAAMSAGLRELFEAGEAQAAAATKKAAARVTAPPALNLVQRLALIPEMSTLVAAVEAAGLVNALSGKGPFTLFAPDDRAFDRLPPGVLPGLLQNKTALAQVLLYHVHAGAVPSTALRNGEAVTTLQGRNIDVHIFNVTQPEPRTVVQLNTDSYVLLPDNDATNGIFHVIDNVLIPPAGLAF